MCSTTTEIMKGQAGVINGKLVLSQGISRAIGTGSAFKEIPIIDLAPMTTPDAPKADKDKLVQEICDACTQVGFFVIKNHGIDWSIVEQSFDALEEFFALPMEKKMEIHQSMSPSFQGYEQPYYTNVDRLAKGGKFVSHRTYTKTSLSQII